MTSDKQVQANRRNARKSTGPKTPEGKDAVRHNALKHGLLSQEALLPNEDEAALKELGESLRAELKPVGEMENLLAERIIASTWRLRRLGRVEAGIFALDLYMITTGRTQEARTYAHTAPPYDDRTEMKRVRDSELAALGQTFVEDSSTANAFSKLSRYETAIERSLYRALHELQRLQAARRANGNVTPPVAVDVNISGDSREDL